MVVLSGLGTYGTQKCSSWFADIHKSKDPEYKHPEIQHSKIKKSKNPKIQYFLHLRNLAIFVGFLDFCNRRLLARAFGHRVSTHCHLYVSFFIYIYIFVHMMYRNICTDHDAFISSVV